MTITSIRLEPETQEILRILGIPFIKIFKRGLVSYGLEGKITDPRVQHLVRKYQQDLIDEMAAESNILENLIAKFMNQESDVQNTSETQITEIIERPEGLSPAMAEMMKKDPIIPIHFIRNIVFEHLSPLNKYDGNILKLRQDIEQAHLEDVDRVAWNIVISRSDLDNLLKAGFKSALKMESKS